MRRLDEAKLHWDTCLRDFEMACYNLDRDYRALDHADEARLAATRADRRPQAEIWYKKMLHYATRSKHRRDQASKALDDAYAAYSLLERGEVEEVRTK
jgi:hypothetical protein